MANAFRLEELDGKIALLTFDLPGKSVNTFGQPVMQELGAHRQGTVETDRSPRLVAQERQAGPIHRRCRPQ